MRTVVVCLFGIACAEPAGPAGGDGVGPPVTGSDSPVASEGPLGPIVEQVVPLVGGGIAAGAEWIAAVDPDGDVVELVHATTRAAQRFTFEAGSAPATVAWTSSVAHPERAHVLLRGNGAIAVLAPTETGSVPALVRLAPICATPRGLAWDDLQELMWVACAGGELVATTADGAQVQTFLLDTGLRDIVVLGDGRAMVSRMRAAEVLIVDLDDGAITARFSPPEQTSPFGHPFLPRLLRRLVSLPDRGALALYQAHDTARVPVRAAQESEAAYGTPGHCGSIVRTVISQVSPDRGFEDVAIVDAKDGFVVDLMPTDGRWPMLATATRIVLALEEASVVSTGEPCLTPASDKSAPVVPTGLVRHGDDVWVATREAFSLETLGDFGPSPMGRAVTGLTMFHDAPAGIACASCHAEGGDDAHTWDFETSGERRTQSLGGLRVTETAPFHWSGELATFDHLVADVGVGRMGLEPPSRDESDALEEFLDLLPAPPAAGSPADPSLVAEGAVLFGDASVGCAECHSGWRYTNGESADVGTGGSFQVPSLLGVGARLPVMHDGCAKTLHDRFVATNCGGSAHGNAADLTPEQIDALVAFLESL